MQEMMGRSFRRWPYTRRCWFTLTIMLLAMPSAIARAETSQLWGRKGQAWSPASRLPDFSFAGYRRSEQPYRIPSESVSVKSFGAKGDGRTDDTEAFRQAIRAGRGKVIEIPAGRYLLSDILASVDSSRAGGHSTTAWTSFWSFFHPPGVHPS